MPSYDENRTEIFLNSVHLHLGLLRLADLGNENGHRCSFQGFCGKRPGYVVSCTVGIYLVMTSDISLFSG